jgi:hypothetical protein
MKGTGCRLSLWVFTLILCAPAWAENPRISLKVENATAAEAVAQLSKAAGIPIDISSRQPGEEERASFDWTNTTFARALRQLCERYGYHPSTMFAGSLMLMSGAAPKRAAMPVGLVEKRGVRLFVERVSVSYNRTLDFRRAPNGDNEENSQLSLFISCELGDLDADAVVGLANVTAKDDQGSFLISNASFMHGRSPFGDSYPDEWSGIASLSGPHPRAKKLEWIEGDLVVFRKYQPIRIEIPLPVTQETAKKQVGPATAEVVSFEPGKVPAGGAGEMAGAGRLSRSKIQARIFVPGETANLHPGARFAPPGPVLVGESGKFYFPNSTSSGGHARPDGMLYEIECGYGGVAEPVVKAIFRLAERSDPETLLSFRMFDIPLPQASPFLPRKAPPPGQRPVAMPLPERPYFQQGGGILVNRIRIGNQAAGEGTLSLGLSVKTGEEWSAVRWTDVEVGQDGVARLEDLKPGTYRLLRNYRPAEAPRVTGAGRWWNGEVIVSVTAGKETVPLPLQWKPAAQNGASPPRKR